MGRPRLELNFDAPVVEMRGVHAAWDGKPVLKGVDLTVNRGERVLLSGENGSGKSTVLSVVRLNKAPSSGEVRLFGVPTATLDKHQRKQLLGGYVASTFQKNGLDTNFTVEDNVSGWFNQLRNRDPDGDRYLEIMTRLGLYRTASDNYLDRPAGHLSGGEQQRVALARALLLGARLLIMDEPTAAINSRGHLNKADVMGIVSDFARRDGSTVLMVSHDPEVYQQNLDPPMPADQLLITREVLLDDGRIVSPEQPMAA
jgi:ABC-type lipoprotein export system ATPase subunit